MGHNDFLDISSDWFFEKYYDKLSCRYWTQKVALGLFLQFGGDNMVETGCARLEEDWGGGYSTYVYGDFASYYGKKLWTCDINEKNLAVAEKVTKPYKDNITYVCDDSIRFLTDFSEKINFLYLDSVDCDPDNEEQTDMAQDHQYKEVEVVLPKLADNCVVLLDDNNYPNGGKTKRAKQLLLDNGFTQIMDFQQSLFVKV
jgi:hypothetical protein